MMHYQVPQNDGLLEIWRRLGFRFSLADVLPARIITLSDSTKMTLLNGDNVYMPLPSGNGWLKVEVS
jgi:hypothetical protein